MRYKTKILMIFIVAFCVSGIAMAKKDIAQSEDMKSVMDKLRAIKAASQSTVAEEKTEDIQKIEKNSNDTSATRKVRISNAVTQSSRKKVRKDERIINENGKHAIYESVMISNDIGTEVCVLRGDSEQYTTENIPKAMGTTFIKFGEIIYGVTALGVDIIDAKNYKTIGDVEYDGQPVPRHSKAVITSDGSKMYIGVIGWGKAAESGVYIIDLKKKKQIGVLEKDNIQRGFIALSEDGNKLYIIGIGSLIVYDVKTDKREKIIEFGKQWFIRDIVSVGQGEVILSVIYEEQKKEAYYLVKVNVNQPGKYREKKIQIPSYADGIEYNASNQKIYATTRWTVMEIDFDKNKYSVLFEGPVGNIALSKKYLDILYITVEDDRKVVIFDIAKKKIIQTLMMKGEPYEIDVL